MNRIRSDAVTELSSRKIRIQPFLKTYFGWGALSLLVVLGFTPDPTQASLWFGIFFGLVGFNLFFLGKTVAVITVLMSDQVAEKQASPAIQLAFWGLAKFLTLATLIAVILLGKDIPMLSLVLGIGTLLTVPFFGGFWWSRLENQAEKGREFLHAQ